MNTVNNLVHRSKRRLLTAATVLVALACVAWLIRAIASDAENQLSFRAGTHAEPQTRVLKTWTPMGSGEISDDAGWTWVLAGAQSARTEFTINTPGERVAGTLTRQPQNCSTSVDWTIALGGQQTSGTLTTASPTTGLDLGPPDNLDHMTVGSCVRNVVGRRSGSRMRPASGFGRCSGWKLARMRAWRP